MERRKFMEGSDNLRKGSAGNKRYKKKRNVKRVKKNSKGSLKIEFHVVEIHEWSFDMEKMVESRTESRHISKFSPWDKNPSEEAKLSKRKRRGL